MARPIAMILAAAATLVAGPASAEVKKLIYGSYIGGQIYHNRVALPRAFEAIAKDTGGTVAWEVLAGGQTVSSRTTLPGLRDRIVDGGFVVPSFTRRELIHSNILYDMAFHGEDAVAVSGAVVETIMLGCPECLEDYRAYNAVYLGGYATTPLRMICRDEIKGIDDLKGKRVRAIGATSRWIGLLGATMVNMSAPDGVSAMQRGAVDCSVAALGWLRSMGYIDATRTIIDAFNGSPRGNALIAMNRDSWRALTAEQKRAHLRHLPLAQALVTIEGYIVADRADLAAARERGISVVDGGERWRSLVARHVENENRVLPEELGRLGARNTERIMNTFADNYRKWERLSAGIGADVDKFVALLREHIYDRVDPDSL